MSSFASVSRRAELLVAMLVGLAGAIVAWIVVPDSSAGPLMVLGVALVVGGSLELRTEGRRGLLLSNAVVLVIVASYPAGEAAVTIIAAELVAAWVRPASGPMDRALRFGEQCITGAATLVVYQLVYEFGGKETLGFVFLALLGALIAQLAADETVRALFGFRSGLGERGRLAWLALGSSGILMALGYRGVDGKGEFGLWGVLLFAVPLMATWFAFERFDSATRTHLQTIDALSIAPELGGLVPNGHSSRVADLADELAMGLGVDELERQNLETAAKLHHLGVVTLDDPAGLDEPHSPRLVAEVTASMLGEIPRLEPAAQIVAGEQLPNRRPRGGKSPMVESQILKVASAYDDLTDGDDTQAPAALEVLYSAPSYMYDSVALLTLERVLEHRGLLDTSEAG